MAYTTSITNEDADEAKVVGISSVSLSEDLQNALRVRPKGTSKSKQTGLPTTKITDKKKFKWILTVTGFLECDSDANYPTALNKKEALIGGPTVVLGKLFRPKPIKLSHRSEAWLGAIEKIQIREESSRADKSGGGTNKFSITFVMVVGTVK